MKWQIITIGKPALAWARTGAEDYLQRLRRSAQVEHVALRDGTESQVTSRTLEAGAGALRIVLDERGKNMSSTSFADWIARHQLQGTKRVCVHVGGADGHPQALRDAAHEIWSLSAFTLQHELALVMFLEQLYRAHAILSSSPYHRA